MLLKEGMTWLGQMFVESDWRMDQRSLRANELIDARMIGILF